MNIQELNSYNLADAVQFNDELNPRIWQNKKMRPEVRQRLLDIAADFREFLGLSDLELKDITVSGSNASYTYTPHSDIDLHLVADIPEADSSAVYRELFDAKKFQYNQLHNITIGGYDVELYVENANSPPVSQGNYSVLHDRWISYPRQRPATVDDDAVRSKYEDLSQRIDQAVNSGDADVIADLAAKIRRMRQAGLDQHGELGPENLAYKMLRTQGAIGRLYRAKTAARDRELSLAEQDRVRKPVRYGFVEVDTGQAQGSSIGDEGAQSTWDGVSPHTDEFLNEQLKPDTLGMVTDFVKYCVQQLALESVPKIQLRQDPEWSARNHSFGQFDAAADQLTVAVANRHVMDILRTVAHELVHSAQQQQQGLPPGAGHTGSEFENEANARAGILMRGYADLHPEYFEIDQSTVVEESQTLDEWAQHSRNLQAVMKQKGYRLLGSGNDQHAYLAPNGLVLKIFGTGDATKGSTKDNIKFTDEQRMFFDFVKFCQARPNNPYLPKFPNPTWAPFEFEGRIYLQIWQERLKEKWEVQQKFVSWAEAMFRAPRTDRYKLEFERAFPGSDPKVAWQTVKDLQKIGDAKGYEWDLHENNVMMRGTTPVIIDPWYIPGAEPMFESSGYIPTEKVVEESQTLDEWATHSKKLQKVLKQKGYRLIGSGADQQAYLAPNGFVLKVFGTGSSTTGSTRTSIKYTPGQRMFFDFVEFCKARPNNPHLPRFPGKAWAPFEFDGKIFLQIWQERLQKNDWAQTEFDEIVGTMAASGSYSKWVKKWGGQYADSFPAVDLTLVWQTVQDLLKIGRAKGYNWDMHPDNIMMRGATPVIIDPWMVYGDSMSEEQVVESSGYIPTEKQKNLPQFKMALSVDVRPGEVGRQANKLGLKTDSQGHPALLLAGLKNAWQEFKQKPTMESQEFLDELKINNQSGIGAVPLNQDVDYFGLRVAMRPSKFLQLGLPLDPDDPREQKIIQWVADRLDDPGIGAPFLDVQIPPQWEDGDFAKPAKITGHDGRHRMYAILQKHGDSPVEVHMIPRGGLRRRDLSDEWIQQLQAGVRGQTGQYVRDIFVSAA